MKNAQFNYPGVSCQCITYKRADFLEEAIESFLKQDYPGPKELIILNDDEEQTLHFNHPEIKIFNIKERFSTIGEKRNESVKLSKYDLLMPWDDDDIYLPHKISFCVEKLKSQGLEYYNLNQGFYFSMSEKIIDLVANLFHANSTYTRKLFNKIEGYSKLNVGEDMDFEHKLMQITSDFLVENFHKNEKITKQNTTYFYRWGGVSHHLSSSKNKNALEEVKKYRSITEKRKGDIYLKPHWKEDYIELAKKYYEKFT